MKNRNILRFFSTLVFVCMPSVVSALDVTVYSGGRRYLQECMNFYHLENPNTMVGFADIKQITTKKFGETGSCYSIQYHTTESVLGELPEKFDVSACDKNTRFEKLVANLAASVRTKIRLADINVLVSLTEQKNEPSELRLLDLACHRFPHIRLEIMSEKAQDRIMMNLQHEISKMKTLQRVQMEASTSNENAGN